MRAKAKYCVYKHTAPSGKMYIGVTCVSPEKRWNHGRGYKYNTHFWNAIVKYGWDSFSHEILVSGLNGEVAYALERELIAAYDSTNPSKGYNITAGGLGGASGIKNSDETRQRKSQSALLAWDKRGRKHNSPEGEENALHMARKAEKNPYPGRKKRRVLQFTLDGVLVREWDSLGAIEKEAGIPWRGVQRSCNNRNRTCHGYAWKFKEECA